MLRGLKYDCFLLLLYLLYIGCLLGGPQVTLFQFQFKIEKGLSLDVIT